MPTTKTTRSSSAQSKTTTDHDFIRRWAEEREGKPARVKGTGGKNDPGMLRINFPGWSGEESLEPISWDEWFKAFDDNKLALLYQDTTKGGQESRFNKLVSRTTASRRGSAAGAPAKTASSRSSASSSRSSSGAKRSSSSTTRGTSSTTRGTSSTTRGSSGTTRGSSSTTSRSRGSSTSSTRASSTSRGTSSRKRSS